MNEVENQIRLKPCPFCGAVPSLHTAYDPGYDDNNKIYWLKDETTDCILANLLASRLYFKDELDKLIESWNKRVSNK
jgi:hypothetical protein